MANNELVEKDKIFSALLQMKLPRKTTLSSSEVANRRIFSGSNSVNLFSLLDVRARAVLPALNVFSVDIEFKSRNGERITILCSDEASCNEFVQKVESNIFNVINTLLNYLNKVISRVERRANELFDSKVYIKRSELRELERELRNNEPLEKLKNRVELLLESTYVSKKLKKFWQEKLSWLEDLLSETPDIWHEHNEGFIQEQYIKYKGFFNTVESSKLTEYQAKASLIFDDANLVLAAAGSGKTSVMVAKIGYALASKTFEDKDIIALAYNRSAKEELKTRIPNKLSRALGRKVKVRTETFHALGRYLLGNRPDGRPWEVYELDSAEGTVLFNRAYNSLLDDSPKFRQALLEWVAYARYSEPEIEPSEGTVEDHERRFMEACMRTIRLKKEKGSKIYEPKIPTFKPGTKVRSLQEARLVNWLYLHDVQFEYEKPNFEELAKTLGVGKGKNGKQKPYCPDFTYISSRNGRYIYHEHFGIDDNGKAPDFLGGMEYERQAQAKRDAFEKVFKLEAAHYFFETCSGDFYSESVFGKLKEALVSREVEVRNIDKDLEYRVLRDYSETSELQDLLVKFISTYRNSGLKISDVDDNAAKSEESYRAKKFLEVIRILVPEIERVYKEAGCIEYSDMLSKGIVAAKESGAELPYKFILVDEFQDSSKLKIELVRALAKNKKGSVIFFVGDDWQAINRFSGSDINIFHKYINYNNKTVRQGAYIDSDYRSTHIVELPDTFRYPQGIANVSKEVVLKNTSQIKKTVKAALLPNIEKTIRIVEHQDTSTERLGALDRELKKIAESSCLANEGRKGVKTSVFILTRNKKDTVVPEGMEPKYLNKILEKYDGVLEIIRNSMHSSKGAEADFTIIVGMDSGYKGFPSDMRSDPLVDLVLPKGNNPVEEERRLFYVALTRSKRQSILLTAAERPSVFITELSKMKSHKESFDWEPSNIQPKKCPSCKKGYIRQVRQDFRSCTRFPVCGYNDV